MVPSSDQGSDSELEDVAEIESHSYKAAEGEFNKLERYFKHSRYLPTSKARQSKTLGPVTAGGRSVTIGPVEKEGADLASGKNLAGYVDKSGDCDIVAFYEDHASQFPKLRLIALKRAAGDNVEVDCERFFSRAGYISQPSRTRLNITTYERLAIISKMMGVVLARVARTSGI